MRIDILIRFRIEGSRLYLLRDTFVQNRPAHCDYGVMRDGSDVIEWRPFAEGGNFADIEPFVTRGHLISFVEGVRELENIGSSPPAYAQ